MSTCPQFNDFFGELYELEIFSLVLRSIIYVRLDCTSYELLHLLHDLSG